MKLTSSRKSCLRARGAQKLARLALALCCAAAFTTLSVSISAEAILVQPYNYLLDDSPLIEQHDSSGSLSPYLNDQASSSELQADKDIASIIGQGLARLRWARMLDNQHQQQDSEHQHLSQEMADLIQSEQQAKQQQDGPTGEQHSISSSMASMILNVAQAAAAAAASADQHQLDGGHEQAHNINAADQQAAASSSSANVGQLAASEHPSRSIMELEAAQAAQAAPAAASPASKSDLKVGGPSQWFNPKETIPVLKISSMATPSKYKKVYFRSEKKLVDGAFHGPASEAEVEKKASLVKAYNSGVQRRSSRGSGAASGAPPSILQDGVIDFLKKFRDVYVQTRPVGAQAGAGAAAAPASPSASALNFVSSLSSAALPLANMVSRPSGSGGSSGRPNFGQMLSLASSIVSQATLPSGAGSQAASVLTGAGSGPSSSAAQVAGQAAAASLAANSALAGAASASSPSKSPLSAQSYVSFWSKTFPTWVRKVLKQMRRRSLYKDNSKKRHQHHALSQKIAHGAVANVADSPSSSGGSGSSSSGSSSSSSSSS